MRRAFHLGLRPAPGNAGALAQRRPFIEREVGFFALIVLQVVALVFVGFCAQDVDAHPTLPNGRMPAGASPPRARVAKTKAKKKSFREVQKNHSRVKAARKNAQKNVEQAFAAVDLAYPPGHVFIRVIKDEDVVELWGANTRHDPMVRVKTFAVCARSGTLGPKRQQGDLQVPEGFYELSRFNPWSAYHLSLGVSYPNRSDRKKGRRPLGGDILIHGDCVTIGCIPIEDGPIEELYVALLDARLNGQKAISLHIFPSRLDDSGLERLIALVDRDDERIPFWRNLQEGYTLFETQKVVPKVKVDRKGDYVTTSGRPSFAK